MDLSGLTDFTEDQLFSLHLDKYQHRYLHIALLAI